MSDRISPIARSQLMSRVKSKHTKPEIMVRSALHRAGFRFVLHRKDLPGKPDITLPKHRTVVLVNGCFWHGHGCKRGKPPEQNREFWASKISRNRARDTVNVESLQKLGWRALTIWECSLDEDIERLLQTLGKPNDP